MDLQEIGPIAFAVSGWQFRWYNLALLIGLCSVWLGATRTLRRGSNTGQAPAPTVAQFETLMIWLPLGFLVGGRLGFVISDWPLRLSFVELFAVHEGGMSSFGAMAGVLLAGVVVCAYKGGPLLATLDLIAVNAPIGILAIRLANFINGDIVGAPTNESWDFLSGGAVYRHPVAIYEAVAEGFLLLVVLQFLMRRGNILQRPGLATGIFLMGYAGARGGLEQFRLAEAVGHGTVYIASMASFLLGLVIVVIAISRSYAALSQSRSGPPSSQQYKRFKPRAAALLSAMGVAMIVPACGTADRPPNSGPAEPLVIRLTNPNAEPRCPCQNATGAYIENISARSYRAKWQITIRDTTSGEFLSEEGADTVLPGSANKLFIGCSQYAPATQCRFAARHSIKNWSSLTVSSAAKAPIYGDVTTPSISTCVARCSDPNEECLRLGVRYYKGIAPLSEMISQAVAGGGTVKISDIFAKYGVPSSYDKCNRGDIVLQNGRFVNEGNHPGKVCLIPSDDLPKSLLDTLGIAASGSSPTKLITSLPARVEAVRAGNIAALAATEVTTFDTSPLAPALVFDGAAGEKFTEVFGGPVLATARIALPNLPRQTVVATGNGCLAVDEP